MQTYFTQDHEWIQVKDNEATIGITDYAQKQLGDVVFVELPEVGVSFDKGDEAAVVESVKAASEVYAPISGAITAVNTDLEDEPERVNSAAEDEGWFFKMTIENQDELSGLMDAEGYKSYCAGL